MFQSTGTPMHYMCRSFSLSLPQVCSALCHSPLQEGCFLFMQPPILHPRSKWFLPSSLLSCFYRHDCCPLQDGVGCSDNTHCCPDLSRCFYPCCFYRHDCCPLQNGVGCSDNTHCCPADAPVCDTQAGTCSSADGKKSVPWTSKSPATLTEAGVEAQAAGEGLGMKGRRGSTQKPEGVQQQEQVV